MASPPASTALPTVQLDHICSPIPTATLLHIANVFWAANQVGNYFPTSLQPYSEYYTEQCRIVYHSLGTNLPFSKHRDIIQLAQEINQGFTRQQVLRSVEGRYPAIVSNTQFDKSEVINGAVDLAARLLLMVDVGKPATNRLWTGRACRPWDQGTIRDFTASTFLVQRSSRHDGIQLDTNFNARNINVIAGLKIELTNNRLEKFSSATYRAGGSYNYYNLLDHLEVVDIEGETTVMIFHHASFLKNQEHPLFPDGFVYETLQTLALLFPQNNWYKASKTWYHKHLEPTTPDADPGVLACGPLTMTHIDAYQFWHDRLIRLKQVFDQAKPRNLRQWWNDRREGTQWYALWIAVGFTVLFGLVQSIEGALQVYKAYHPEGNGSG